ncbi:MAG: antibiotic biosynthesis monooxygenase [Bacteroidetes bacterium]|nr:antibiotic biosynthesis monooxygenase [Bacteroidota bacterium]
MNHILIDRLTVPANAKEEFIERMNINRAIIHQQPGFIRDEIFQPVNTEGDLVYYTMAIWENEAALKMAREKVQAAYQQEGFDLAAFCREKGIQIERGIYHKLND